MRVFRWLIPMLAVVLLSACGGGSGSSDTVDTTGDDSSSVGGTISDPYIFGANFGEYSAAGVLLQETEAPSTITGAFTFSKPILVGSTIRMISTEKVFHATPLGALSPYEGPLLTRRVSQALAVSVNGGGKVIVTPLTTLADKLQTAAEKNGDSLDEDAAIALIATMINDANGGADLVKADLSLFADPMAAFEDGGNQDVSLLQASMAVAVAMESNDIDGSLAGALDLIQTLLPAGSVPSEARFVAATTIVAKVCASDDPDAIVDKFDAETVKAIVDAADLLGAGEVLEVTEGGNVATINYQAQFSTAMTAAKTKIESTLGADWTDVNGDMVPLNSEMVAMANSIKTAKVDYDQAIAAGATLTVAQADQDQLNFFYGFSRVILLLNPLTDGNDANGLQRLSDVLDAFGVSKAQEVREENLGLETCVTTTYSSGDYTWDEEECSSTIFEEDANGESIIPETTPTTGELQAFLYQRAAEELKSAIIAFDAVSTTFNYVTTYESEDTEFDYSDALYVKALANAALAQISLQQGLKIDVDISAIATRENGTVQDVLTSHPNLLQVKDASALAQAKAFALAAVTGMKEAINAIDLETDGQEDDLINFYEEIPADLAAAITAQLADLDKIYNLLNSSADFTTAEGTAYTVNLANFFAGTVDLNTLLPTFAGNNPGMFPDPTLGGIISTDIGLNDDEYVDGVPDILQDDLIKFTEPMLVGQTFLCWHNDQYLLQFATVAHGFTLHVPGTEQPISGSWELSEDGQQITLSSGATAIATIAFDEGWSDDWGMEFNFPMTFTGADSIYFDQVFKLEPVDFTVTNSSVSAASLGLVGLPSVWFYLSSDNSYVKYINNILSFNGTWVVDESGQLTLTLNNGDSSIFILTHAYRAPYNEDGTPNVLFFTVDGVEKAFNFYKSQN